MPRFWRAFLRGAIPVGLAASLLCALTTDWPYAILFGVLGGVFFGLTMAVFASSRWVKQSASPTFDAHEQIVKEGPANHFKGLEGVGGWLFLTDQRLVFKAHPFNFQRHELSLSLPTISEAQSVLTLWVLPNGLRITTYDGRVERFVVEEYHEWSQCINALLARPAVKGGSPR